MQLKHKAEAFPSFECNPMKSKCIILVVNGMHVVPVLMIAWSRIKL